MIAPAGQKISDEQIADANPDVIILAWAATGDRANPAKTYAVEKWRSIAAIRNRRVFVVRDELLNTPAPILAQGARELAKIFAQCRKQSRSRP
jgi:iron complex transport system substrate-binding protein